MATTVYESRIITLLDESELYITPLKIKYLRRFMDDFEEVKKATNDVDSIYHLLICVFHMMPQYRPEVKTLEEVEDLVSLPMIYEILEVAAGVKMAKNSPEEPVSKKAENSESSWDTFDLAKLESEAFLLGIWKDFEELETSLSMPELTAVLSAKREDSYEEKKFLAAIQGVDIEKNKNESNAWEEMKARVFSGGKAENGSDILAFQGANAAKAGFGIGLGLAYEDLG
jgi:hypothetical protein